MRLAFPAKGSRVELSDGQPSSPHSSPFVILFARNVLLVILKPKYKPKIEQEEKYKTNWRRF